VTAPDRFVALLVTILTGTAILMTGLLWLGRMLWNIRGSWDTTNAELHTLVDRVGHMDARYERLESRVERHEDWHAGRRRR
jgi:hypothetical protein